MNFRQMRNTINIEHYEQRCPRLGNPVTFNYCFKDGDNGHPCWKIADCWWESFDVMTYLKENLPEEAVTRLTNAKPKPKIVSLVELIAQAKSRNRKE